jgi:hypothetical protein
MNNIAQLSLALQTILGPMLDDIGRRAGAIKRQRRFSGSSLLKTIVLTVLKSPEPILDDFVATAAQLDVNVTPQAIQRRFSVDLVAFLRTALQHVLEHMTASHPVPAALLEKFTAVIIGDSTTVTLPEEFADEFPGCGGQAGQGKAAVKIQVRCDLLIGKLTRLFVTPGRHSDAKSEPPDTPVKAGSLSIFDLGYFCIKRFRGMAEQGAYWLSRWFPDTKVFDADGRPLNLLEMLRAHTGDGLIDIAILLGSAERLRCRMIALRAPQEVAARRRQKAYEQAQKHGRTPSKEHLEMCGWTLYVTNCPPELLTWQEVVVLYRSRWQIELLFKLWKSYNRLESFRATWSPLECMVMFWARLLGVVLQHALLLGLVWQNPRCSPWKVARVVREWIVPLTASLVDMKFLVHTLDAMATSIRAVANRKLQRKHPSLFQLLMNPALLDWIP